MSKIRRPEIEKEEGLFQLTNYKNHPSNNVYKVFFFSQKDRADHFENMLKERSIAFESDVDTYKGEPLYLYGIHKTDFRAALDCNFHTVGKFRKPLFGANKWARYFIAGFSILLLFLALLGYFISG